jgi:hypothetical protein
MTVNDFNSGPGSTEQGESLSATGMFLRAFDSNSEAPLQATEEQLAKPAAPPVPSTPIASGPQSSGPGEFTQMFQAREPRQNSVPAPIASQTPQAPPQAVPPRAESQASPAPAQAATPGPGEFTRIFVKPVAPSAELPARPAVEVPPTAVNPTRLKGFSTPGVSDSASAEGSFTQFFKAASAAPASAPAAPPAQTFAPPTPAPPPVSQARDWPREPDFGAGSKPFDLGRDRGLNPNANPTSFSTPAPASGSATGLLSALSSPEAGSAAPRQPDPVPYRPEPMPSYSAPPPAEHSTVEPGSVTRLIQRLSQVPRETPPEPILPPASAPPIGASASSGPGEFTRMISAGAVRAAVESSAQPAPVAPALAAPTPIAIPAPAAPAMAAPAMKAPAPPPAPKFEPPKVEAPKLAPPAVAAPKSKLEAMVPILLIMNTFLLIVLLVVVVFAMKSK